MTDAQAATYHRQYLIWFNEQERRAVAVVRHRLRMLFKRIDEMLATDGATTVGAELDALVNDSDELGMIERIYTTIGVIAAQREYDRLKPPSKFVRWPIRTKDDRDVPPLFPQQPGSADDLLQVQPYSRGWRMKMEQLARSSETARRITQITATTKQLVRDVLARGAEQNWTIRTLGKKLQAVIVDKARAILIARTETTRAASAGSEAGAMSTNLVLQKKWIATADSRTRDQHLSMLRAAPVARDAFFIVGSIPMKYPGDPAGGAANCCNCRCCIAYVPLFNPFDN